MAPIRRDSVDTFRVAFAELAKCKRGEVVLIDPFLIGRAIAQVMQACTVRSAAGRPIVWNEYRVVLARPDFELVRALAGTLERDLAEVLAQEAEARRVELLGALRVTVVFDEADELRAGDGVVRVAFVPTARPVHPAAGELTVRRDGWAAAGEIAVRGPQAFADTAFVDDSIGVEGERYALEWAGGRARLDVGVTLIVGRPHAEAPANFVGLTGAGAKVNKQHFWIALAASSVRIGRLAGANPVHVNGQPIAAAQDIEAGIPAEISLSRGDLVLTVRRR
jgi:hypothetical protein